ncbi:MAG: hypothetical protein ABIK09_20835 [Pseudomonadota bacterium]
MDAETHIVAITALEGNPEEQSAVLATALGITAYEARQHTQPPGPRVVATLADPESAARLAAILEGAGFAPVVLRHGDVGDEDGRIVVRSFLFHPLGLRVETRGGEPHAVRFDRIQMLLQGMDLQRGVETKTTSQRRLALGKAIVTGGMAITKKVKTTKTTERETGGPFLMVYAEGHPTLAFRETELQYQGLGGALQPGRPANFLRLIAELRARAGAARWDGRLMTMAGQRHVLGGVLSPERDLDVALALLAL